MASQSTTDEPLQELKHDAVPGYLRAFLIAFVAMAIYLAVVIISSPGSAKGHYGKGHDDKHSSSSDGEHHETH